MPLPNLDPELRPALVRDALDALDQLLAVAPPDAMISYRLMAAQVRLLRLVSRDDGGGVD